MEKRRNYSPKFKARVALAPLSNEKTLPELSSVFDIHQNLVKKWKAQLKESASDIFTGDIGRYDAKREKNCMISTRK